MNAMRDMKMPNMKTAKRECGLTLIELMVTLAISSVILTGIVNIYVNSLSQSKLTSNLSSMQESGRYALDLMARDIRMAAYTGCVNYDAAAVNASQALLIYKPALDMQALRGVVGMEWKSTGYASADLDPMVTETTTQIGTDGGSWLTSDGATLPSNYPEAIANSDIIQVWSTGETGIDVNDAQDATASSVTLDLDKEHGLQQGDIVMLANCGIVIVAQICTVGDTSADIKAGGSSTCNNDFSDVDPQIFEHIQSLEIFTFRDVTYFIGKRDDGAATSPSLYRGVGGKSKEMVEGVENLQILYGVDLAHEPGELRTPDKYVPADEVGNRWGDVVAVRLSILMRSFEKGLGGESYSFSFNGRDYDATDGYLRQVYSTTVALRNRNVGEVQGLYSTTTP